MDGWMDVKANLRIGYSNKKWLVAFFFLINSFLNERKVNFLTEATVHY